MEDVKARVSEAERDARGEFEALIDHLRSIESVKLAVLSEERHTFMQTCKEVEAVAHDIRSGQRLAHSPAEVIGFLRRAKEIRLTAETLLSKPVKKVQVSLDDIRFEVRERTQKLREHTVHRELLQLT